MSAGKQAKLISRQDAQRHMRAIGQHMWTDAPSQLIPAWQALVAYTDRLEAELAEVRAGAVAEIKASGGAC